MSRVFSTIFSLVVSGDTLTVTQKTGPVQGKRYQANSKSEQYERLIALLGHASS
jgi:hypothetical protein